jgi:hypothetical protein
VNALLDAFTVPTAKVLEDMGYPYSIFKIKNLCKKQGKIMLLIEIEGEKA